MAAGSKIGRSTPLLGLAFLISAITAERPLAILARSAPAKSRGTGDDPARMRISLKGIAAFAAASSLALVARIRGRIARLVPAAGSATGAERTLPDATRARRSGRQTPRRAKMQGRDGSTPSPRR